MVFFVWRFLRLVPSSVRYISLSLLQLVLTCVFSTGVESEEELINDLQKILLKYPQGIKMDPDCVAWSALKARFGPSFDLVVEVLAGKHRVGLMKERNMDGFIVYLYTEGSSLLPNQFPDHLANVTFSACLANPDVLARLVYSTNIGGRDLEQFSSQILSGIMRGNVVLDNVQQGMSKATFNCIKAVTMCKSLLGEITKVSPFSVSDSVQDPERSLFSRSQLVLAALHSTSLPILGAEPLVQ